jgi:hypothetical protein
VAEQELDLLKIATILAAELGAGSQIPPAQIHLLKLYNRSTDLPAGLNLNRIDSPQNPLTGHFESDREDFCARQRCFRLEQSH